MTRMNRVVMAHTLALMACSQFFCCSTVAHAASLRDPTRPGWSTPTAVNTAQDTEKKLATVNHTAISGILFSPQRQLVLFNNRYYRVGDRLGEHLIKRIEPDRIHLVQGEHTLLIQLPRVTSIHPHLSAKP